MCSSVSWRLTRFGRLVNGSEKEAKPVWTVFESKGNEPAIVVTILESGYLLVVQGHKSLTTGIFGTAQHLNDEGMAIASGQAGKPHIQETVPLLGCTDSLKIQQKSDNLLFRLIVKGESHMMRMQFDGNSREEAINVCSNAVEKLKEFLPVATHSLHPNQLPAEPIAATAQGCQEKVLGVLGSLSTQLLTQHYLGETTVTLPQEFHHSPLANCDLEPFLRVFLLDPSFNAFVEKVEAELKKLLEE